MTRTARLGPRYEHAFTLVEILVVVVIMGIISAVALLSLGVLGDDRNLQREAQRLSSLIELANDEAMIQGRDFGLEILRSGYRFVEHDPLINRWHELLGDDLLRARELEDEMEFELFIEDRRVQLDEEAAEIETGDDEEDDRNLTDDYEPHVLILSSGDVTPFELNILRPFDRSTISLTMTLEGEIEIEGDDIAF